MLQSPSRTAFSRCRLLLIAGCCLVLSLELTTDKVQAGGWMYRRSYFSGSTPNGQPTPLIPNLRSRWAYRRPLVGTGYGFAARGGYRYNRIFLQSGQSTDLTVIREDWYDVRP